MSRFLLILGLVLCVTTPSALWARTLRLTLGSGKQVQGELLNTDANGVYLKGQSGKTYFFKSKDIVKVLDVDSDEDLTQDLKDRMEGSSSDSQWTPGTETDPGEAVPAKPQPPETAVESEPAYQVDPGSRRPRARWNRVGPPFKPGFGLDLGISSGSRTPNTTLYRHWREWVPERLADYTLPVAGSVDLGVMFQLNRKFAFGAFGQWYPRFMGTAAGYTGVLDEYTNVYGDTYLGPFDDIYFDYHFGAFAYGAKVRMKSHPRSRGALTLYGGRVGLVDSGMIVEDYYGSLLSNTFSGSAPYWRTDLEFLLVPARRGGVVLSLGYQWANIKEVTVTTADGTSGPLVNYTDLSPVIVDMSGFRVGLSAATRF